MNQNSVLTAILALCLGFGLGFFAGKYHERKSADYLIRGDGWEIRARDYDREHYPQRSRVRVWPFVDVESK